jgi:hypothetical protein
MSETLPETQEDTTVRPLRRRQIPGMEGLVALAGRVVLLLEIPAGPWVTLREAQANPVTAEMLEMVVAAKAAVAMATVVPVATVVPATTVVAAKAAVATAEALTEALTEAVQTAVEAVTAEVQTAVEAVTAEVQTVEEDGTVAGAVLLAAPFMPTVPSKASKRAATLMMPTRNVRSDAVRLSPTLCRLS